MYCKYCGKKIDADSTFCSGCGAKIRIAAKVTPAHRVQTHTDTTYMGGTVPTNASEDIYAPGTKRKREPIPDFDPTLENIMAQFSPVGRVVFFILCILMVIWVASLTIYIFYPEAIDFFGTL